MTLPLVIYRSLRQHALSTLVTAASIALASGLLLCVWMVKVQSQAVFSTTTGGFDAVLGARGSKLQLVLNSVFHLEASPGNIEWDDYQAIRKNPAVRSAIPIAVGDNLRGYRIVGTVPELFSDVSYAPGRRYAVEPGGRFFIKDAKEAVVGSFAAERLGLKRGDTFHPFHGLVFNPSAVHAETYVVTGILKPTNTPADRVVWIPLEGVQTMSGHDPRAAKEVSAVLVQLRSPTAGFRLDIAYNKQGDRLTFAYPVGAIAVFAIIRHGLAEEALELRLCSDRSRLPGDAQSFSPTDSRLQLERIERQGFWNLLRREDSQRRTRRRVGRGLGETVSPEWCEHPERFAALILNRPWLVQ